MIDSETSAHPKTPLCVVLYSRFGSFFGQQQQQEQRGPNIEMDLDVTLEDLYNGATVNVELSRQTLCSKCRGSGARSPDDITRCPDCDGKGHKLVRQQIAPGFVQQMQQQ